MLGRRSIIRLHGLGQYGPDVLQPGYSSVAVDPQTGTVIVPSPGSATTSTVYYQQGTAETGNPLTTTPGGNLVYAPGYGPGGQLSAGGGGGGPSGGGGGSIFGGAGGGPGGGIFGSPGGVPGGSIFGTCDPNSGWGKIFGCGTGGSMMQLLIIGVGIIVLVEVLRR